MGVWKVLNKTLTGINELAVGTVGKGAGKILNKAVNKTPGAVEGVAGALDKGIKGIQKGVGAIRDGAIGKAAAKTTKTILTDSDSYKHIGGKRIGLEVSKKPLILDALSEKAKTIGDTAAVAFDTISRDTIGGSHHIPEIPNPFKLLNKTSDNVLGWKANKRGIAIVGAGALIAGTPKAAKQYVDDRRGNGRSELMPIAPQVPSYSDSRTPAYADNGGATGDLVFALNNLRHGGMM